MKILPSFCEDGGGGGEVKIFFSFSFLTATAANLGLPFAFYALEHCLARSE
jgi:hypothetical protein